MGRAHGARGRGADAADGGVGNSAAKPPKPPKPPHYKVLVVTAGEKNSDVNKAGVKAIKAIGKDDGTKDDPNSKFSVHMAQDQHQIDHEFTAKNLAPLQRRHLPRYRGVCPAQRRAEGPLRGVLPQRRRLPRDRLGDRDRAPPGSSTPTSSAPPLGDVLAAASGSSRPPTSSRGHRRPAAGRTISIDTGANNESATIQTVGTAGAAGTASRSPPRSPSHTPAARPSRCPGRRTSRGRSRRPTAFTTRRAPARVLGQDGRLVELHGQRPRRLARPRHGRRGSVRPPAAGPGARRDRRRHDGRRPSGVLVQGLPGRPLLLHGAGQHREQPC